MSYSLVTEEKIMFCRYHVTREIQKKFLHSCSNILQIHINPLIMQVKKFFLTFHTSVLSQLMCISFSHDTFENRSFVNK